ncbi:intraflagellar transport protein 140 homolog isoform X2 [Dysidea avara]
MSWQCQHKLLAIGWRSGEISVCSLEETKDVFEQSSAHHDAVLFLCWNVSGSRLVSGDQNGMLVIWRVDNKGALYPLPVHKHQLAAPLNHCILKFSTSSPNSWSHPESAEKTLSWQLSSEQDSIACFVASQKGTVYHISGMGTVQETFQVEGVIHTLLYSRSRHFLVIVTQSMQLYQYVVDPSGNTTTLAMNAKLSGPNKPVNIIWAGPALLATCSYETAVRLWDFDRDENYLLELGATMTQVPETAHVTFIDYNMKKSLLAVATSSGHVALWQYCPYKGKSIGPRVEPADYWDLIIVTSPVTGFIYQIRWGTAKGLLAVNYSQSIHLLSEQAMHSHFNEQVSAVQVTSNRVMVTYHSTKLEHGIDVEFLVKGVYVTKEHTAVWSDEKIVVYSLSADKSVARVAGSFTTTSSTILLYEYSVFLIENGQLEVKTLQGTTKQILSCPEGTPTVMSINGHFLVVGMSTTCVKVWDISRREPKQFSSTKTLQGIIPENLISVKCNSTCSHLSIIAGSHGDQSSSTIHVVEMEGTHVISYNFATGLCTSLDTSHNPMESLGDTVQEQQKKHSADLIGRIVVTHYWDSTEPRLLVCEATLGPDNILLARSRRRHTNTGGLLDKKGITPISIGELRMTPSVAVVIFTSDSGGLLLNEIIPIELHCEGLIGIAAPVLYFSKKNSIARADESSQKPDNSSSSCAGHVMRDFIGLDLKDRTAVQSMMKFSVFSTEGNMDEAFKAIKQIKSELVWENMAKMCVRTRRLDVAAVCLGNMRNARAAMALRKARELPEVEAQLAVLAIQLNMLDEAELLYKQCKRYDLLNQFYQSTGQWSRAIEVAETQDRMNLKTTYYNYGNHVESIGELSAAINCYEKSETHCYEVPRMLLDDPDELQEYVMKSKDKTLYQWWAEYMESLGDLESALQFYRDGSDHTSIVRIHCYMGNIDKAIEEVERSGDRAASFHLGQRLEADDPQKAIHYYTKAQTYSTALKLAKECDLQAELMSLALLCSEDDKLEAARIYESNPATVDKAIILYQEGGNITSALELCFQYDRFELLQEVARELDWQSEPDMVQRCVEFFNSHGEFEKSIELLVKVGKLSEVLDICLKNYINISEELADRLAVGKPDDGGETPEEATQRVAMLEKVAEACAFQGNHHLAAKKFTQAGNKVKAMKALLKSGDTAKIIFFAQVSRQRDIYIMAANYLQTLDWRSDPEVMKNIITFYTKGKALESLAGFYDACAQVEIDEYQNYDKALGALNESLKCFGKVKSRTSSIEAKIQFLQDRIGLVGKFAEARRSYEERPDDSVEKCALLLDEPSLDTAVRVGDVYGMMIEHYAHTGNYQKAYSLMEEMRERIPSVNMAFYIDIQTIETVHATLGVPMKHGLGAETSQRDQEQEEDGMEEEDSEPEELIEEDYSAVNLTTTGTSSC